MHGPESLDFEQLFGLSTKDVKKAMNVENNLSMDTYDKRTYRELQEASGELRGISREGEAAFDALLNDIWGTYYKADPELTPEEKVSPDYKANRPYLETLLSDPATEQARVITMLDELSAGLATIEAGKKLRQEIDSRPELKKAMQQANEAVEAQDEGQGSEMAEQVRQALQQHARDVRRAIKAAVEAGKEKADQVNGLLAGWGMEPGDLKSVPIGERMKLVERLNGPNLKKAAAMVGRFRNLARARQKEKLKKQRDEIHGITVGSDLPHVLPAELGTLNDPVMRLDFFRKYTENQLLQYELTNREKQGRGPMIVLVDRSGSMSGYPMDWAAATALALADTAARQKRQTLIAYFDTRIQKQIELKPGERDINKMVEIATVGAGGGTDYQPALALAMERIMGAKNYRQADVVMITDGLCQLPEDFLTKFKAAKKEKGFRCWSVLIGSDPWGELKKWSDETWPVRSLTEDVAGDVFERVY